MVPFHYISGGWWFLAMAGIIVFMMLACFLFRRVFHGGAFCCAGGVGRKNAGSNDPVWILKSRYAKGEIGGGGIRANEAGDPGGQSGGWQVIVLRLR